MKSFFKYKDPDLRYYSTLKLMLISPGSIAGQTEPDCYFTNEILLAPKITLVKLFPFFWGCMSLKEQKENIKLFCRLSI